MPGQRELILASASPRRRKLLEEWGVPFRVMVSGADEWEPPSGIPEEVAAENARRKGRQVASGVPEAWVLSSDTVVALGEDLLHKPSDQVEAIAALQRLSGKTHQVISAVCLTFFDGKGLFDTHQAIGRASVRFKVLTRAIIDEYLSAVHTLDKAGGYAIQERGELLIESFEGCMSTVIGLPKEETMQLLAGAGVQGVY